MSLKDHFLCKQMHVSHLRQMADGNDNGSIMAAGNHNGSIMAADNGPNVSQPNMAIMNAHKYKQYNTTVI